MAGRTNASACSALRSPDACGRHYAATARCEWNGRAKRCEPGRQQCLHLAPLPSQTCESRLLAFIHINRVAGGSIAQGIGGCVNATQRLYYRDGASTTPMLSNAHLTAKDYLQQWEERTGACAGLPNASECGRAWRGAVFSFAIVRNPFDRQVSLFHSLLLVASDGLWLLLMASDGFPHQVSLFHSLLERDCSAARHSPRAPSRQCEARRFPFVDSSWRNSVDGQVLRCRQWVLPLTLTLTP